MIIKILTHALHTCTPTQQSLGQSQAALTAVKAC